MNACKKHWDAMRAKITELGLMHLVAGSGQEAMDRTVRALESFQEGTQAPVSDWDPLMSMSNNFFGRVAERMGLGMFVANPETGKPPCPLCLVREDFDAHNTPTGRCGKPECVIQVSPGEKPWDEAWIDSCGDAMLKHAAEKGFIKTQ